MSDLRSSLTALAQSFANQVLAAIRSASLEELVADDVAGPPAAPRAAAAPARRPQVVRSNGPIGPRAATPAGAQPARSPGKGPLARRTPAMVQKTLGAVVALLKNAKTGMRSEEIRDALGLDKREMPRVLQTGLTEKKLRSKGQKRSTTYTAA